MVAIEAQWAKVPLELISKHPSLVRVYAYLDYYAGKRGYWYGTYEEFNVKAKDEGLQAIPKSTLFDAIKALTESGFITAHERPGTRQTTYYVLARTVPVNRSNSPENRRDFPDNRSESPENRNGATSLYRSTDLPQTPTTDHPAAAAAAFRAWEEASGTTITAAVGDMIAEAVETHGLATVLDAIKETAANNVRAWKYTQSILRRWESGGRQPRLKATPGGNPNWQDSERFRNGHWQNKFAPTASASVAGSSSRKASGSGT